MDQNQFEKLLNLFFDATYKPVTKPGKATDKRRQKFIADQKQNFSPVDKEIFELAKRYLKNSDDKILDDGCGLGEFLFFCQEANLNATGIDPDKLSASIAQLRLIDSSRAKMADGEHLPFADDEFDVITSKTVIEHVKNPQIYFNEAKRVLKPDGYFILFAPNYSFPWEGHFKIFWLPYLLPYTKNIFKLCAKIMRLDSTYANGINFKITDRRLKNMLFKAGFKKISDVSWQRFEKRFNNPEIIANPLPKKILINVKNNALGRIFMNWALALIKKLKLYHPLIFICQK